jgi:predicted nuclease of predicted toxin-antitoxin system
MKIRFACRVHHTLVTPDFDLMQAALFYSSPFSCTMR